LAFNFEDPGSGAAEAYLANRTFRKRQSAECVVAWLEKRAKEDSMRCGSPITLKASIQETAQDFFTITGSQTYRGQTLQL